MEKETKNSWKLLDEQAALAKDTAAGLQRLIAKLQQACIEGALHKTAELSDSIQGKISEISRQIIELDAATKALRISSNDLQKSVEVSAKEQQISGSIFSSTPNLVVHPLVIRFNESDKGPELTIGGVRFISNRADYVIGEIKLHRKKAFNLEAFMKSLKAAYDLLLRSESQREVALEAIRQVLSINSDSTNRLSHEEFNLNLQLLYSENLSGKKIEMPKFVPVAAAARKYLLFGKDGSSISVGAISFTKAGSPR